MMLKDKVKKLRLKKIIIKQDKHDQLRKLRNLKENNPKDMPIKEHANQFVYYKKYGKQILYYTKDYLNNVSIKNLIHYDEINKIKFTKKTK